MPVHAGQLVKMHDLGRDEHWLQDWLVEDLTRLGLGPLSIVEQEQTQIGGGNLDILASNSDTYYSIEVQLGEVDSSHGFRAIDYWARNRRRFPSKTHIVVLVVESASGRYRIALEELAQFIPLLVVELRSWRGTSEIIMVPELVITNSSVDVSETPLALSAGEGQTKEDWEESATKEAWQFSLDLEDWVQSNLGPIYVDYSPKSYIGFRVGRRVWAPLWLRQDGAQLYLPDPDLSRKDESPAFDRFRDKLNEDGIQLQWQTTYNAGANPVSVRLRRTDLHSGQLQELLRATYEAVKPGAQPWSQLNPAESSEVAPEEPAFPT